MYRLIVSIIDICITYMHIKYKSRYYLIIIIIETRLPLPFSDCDFLRPPPPIGGSRGGGGVQGSAPPLFYYCSVASSI